MKIAVLGTGTVGKTIGTKLLTLGHRVMMGSRTADNRNAAAWVADHGAHASQGTYADAAAFGDMAFNCTSGMGALQAIESAGDALDGKVLLDLTNPLDFANGFPPTLSVCNDDSLGESIQRAFPKVRVVKTLNTVANPIMVDPGSLGEETTMFVCGNDADAKAQAISLLTDGFGWTDVIDMGDIGMARGLESWLPLWVRLFSVLGHADFNLKIVRKPKD